METSPINKISPNCIVTPDAVIQRDENLGYVVEAKTSIPQNHNDNWRDIVNQVIKYDDDLVGWWTGDEKIPLFCPVLLLHISRSADFRMYLNSLIDGHQAEFVRPVSIVEFDRSQQVKEFLFLRLYWGAIEDTNVLRDLQSGRSVPIEKVLANQIYGEKKFCDFPPIPEHTMTILWQNVFVELKRGVVYDSKVKAYPLTVNAETLTLDLQKLYGAPSNEQRQITYPRVEWVRDALDCFVKLKLAKKLDQNGDYLIYYKYIRENLVEVFRKWRQVKDEEDVILEEKQLSLF